MKANEESAAKVQTFLSPNKIMLGPGAVRSVGTEAKRLGAKRALLITDKGVLRTGMAETIKEALAVEQIETVLFDKVELETPVRVVDEGARFVSDSGCDLLVALGGGTTLDTTKGISIVVTNGGSVLDYVGVGRVPKRGLTKVMVPTTGGSGSEVSAGFGVTDEGAGGGKKTKKAVNSPFNLADAVILDPLLTCSLPPLLTAETGIDALSHAAEAYVSHFATPFSDMLALEGIRLVGRSLLSAYAKGENVEARSDMLLAATLGGLAFSSGGLGACHAFSFALETDYALSHARAVSVMLPHIMEYNRIGALRKYEAIAQALGEKTEGLSGHAAAQAAVAAVRGLLDTLGISCRLRDYGISDRDIPALTAATMGQGRLFAPNPRNLTEEDVRGIYLRAL